MNPVALRAFADFLAAQMGPQGTYAFGTDVAKVELIAPFWPENEQQLDFDRDGLTGLMLANDVVFTKYQEHDAARFRVWYEHDAAMSLFVRSQERLPLDGLVYVIPAIIEHLTHHLPAAVTDEGISGVSLTRARFTPSQNERERNLLIVEASFRVKGVMTVNRFTRTVTGVELGVEQGGPAAGPVVPGVSVTAHGGGPDARQGPGRPGPAVDAHGGGPESTQGPGRPGVTVQDD